MKLANFYNSEQLTFRVKMLLIERSFAKKVKLKTVLFGRSKVRKNSSNYGFERAFRRNRLSQRPFKCTLERLFPGFFQSGAEKRRWPFC